MQKICKILNKLIFNQEKLKMCKFPLTSCLQKICIFFRKTCAIPFLVPKAFQKAKFYQNLTSGSGSKQRFSSLQEFIDISCLFVCKSLCPQPLSKNKLLKLKSLLREKAVIQAVKIDWAVNFDLVQAGQNWPASVSPQPFIEKN